jgi:hypothetical protein
MPQRVPGCERAARLAGLQRQVPRSTRREQLGVLGDDAVPESTGPAREVVPEVEVAQVHGHRES